MEENNNVRVNYVLDYESRIYKNQPSFKSRKVFKVSIPIVIVDLYDVDENKKMIWRLDKETKKISIEFKNKTLSEIEQDNIRRKYKNEK